MSSYSSKARATVTFALLSFLLVTVVPASANHDVTILPDIFPKIRAIVSPLASQPAIVEDGSSLRVELDPTRVGEAALEEIEAWLVPSFGAAREETTLDRVGVELAVPSSLWPDRDVHAITLSVPAFGGVFVEDLYDLVVDYGEGVDRQHRAVKVVDVYPEDPTFAVIADPSVGDPRPIQEGAENFIATGSPDSFVDKTTKTVGNPMNEDRWAALGRAISEINLLQPDFVLVAGDLTFGVYPRPANVEYEDAYRILSRLRVPAFMSPGNHDLYDFDYDDLERPHTTDGKELWPLYFGPLYYSVDVGPDLHLVSMNTFDWEDHEREPVDEGDEFEIRSGGQIDNEQFAWLDEELHSYRDQNPDGAIITFAHHDPSWIEARHPWPGKNRLETRDLLAALKVGVHFAGHTHEDRVARYHQGNVVETNGRFGPDQELHYVLRHDELDEGWTQDDLGSILRDPTHGPLFVTTTTVSSVLKGEDWGLGGYWGYRFGILHEQAGSGRAVGRACDSPDRSPPSAGSPSGDIEPPSRSSEAGCGYDPIDFGYPATREFLDANAERPEKWNPDHARYGVFSYPSYFLDASIDGANDGTEPTSSLTVSNDLFVDVQVEVVLSVSGDGARVTGGDVVWTRTIDGVTDVKVRTTVTSGGTETLSARAN
ncbi:MAG: metallophosphoesterase family protein [Actinomycetota bacterium]